MSLFPFSYKDRNQFRRILEITAKADGAVPGCLTHAVERRIELAKVGNIKNRLYFFVPAAGDWAVLPFSPSAEKPHPVSGQPGLLCLGRAGIHCPDAVFQRGGLYPWPAGRKADKPGQAKPGQAGGSVFHGD